MRVCVGLFVVVIAVSVCGCGGDHPPAQKASYVDKLPPPEEPLIMKEGEVGTHGGRFVITGIGRPETFNPVVATTGYSYDITGQLFVSLANFDFVSQEDRPALAKSWECNTNGLSCSFELRRGANFSDGHAITSADVLFSVGVMLDTNIAARGRDTLQMDGLPFAFEAPDAFTVIVRAPKPNGGLLSAVGGVAILPKHVLEPAVNRGAFNSAYGVSTPPDELVTSGPWRIKEHLANERTVLTRNPHWFKVDTQGQRLPYLDELVFEVVPNQDTADLKFQSGDVDAIGPTPQSSVQWYAEHRHERAFTLHELGTSLSASMMYFNQNVPPSGPDHTSRRIKAGWFRNPTFRRAVSKAIDRDAMIRSVFFGRAVKSWGYATPADKLWGGLDVPHDDFDLATAQEMLTSLRMIDRDGDGIIEDAEGHPVTFSLAMGAGNQIGVANANFIRDDLSKVGIKVTLSPLEFNTLMTNVRSGAFDAVTQSFLRGRATDPPVGIFRSTGAHSWEKPVRPPLSAAQARVDELSGLILGSTDHHKRREWLKELNTIVNDQAWVIWLPVATMSAPVKSHFGNVRPTSLSTAATNVIWNADEIFQRP